MTGTGRGRHTSVIIYIYVKSYGEEGVGVEMVVVFLECIVLEDFRGADPLHIVAPRPMATEGNFYYALSDDDLYRVEGKMPSVGPGAGIYILLRFIKDESVIQIDATVTVSFAKLKVEVPVCIVTVVLQGVTRPG